MYEIPQNAPGTVIVSGPILNLNLGNLWQASDGGDPGILAQINSEKAL